jgi:hypothetical protein
MIDCVDQSVGQLVAALRERELLDNTLILFFSDNGGNAESGPWGITDGEPWGGPDSRVFLGMSWATLNNTPFRRYKHFTHEGGIATPLIAHWPAGIPADRRGSLDHQPSHVIDLMPTAVEMSGAVYPERRHGRAILPMEGVSLLPALAGQSLQREPPIFWEHEGNRAVRCGPWKAVMRFQGRWELYHIDTDRTEQHDRAAEQPERVARMAAQWESWAADSFVDPWLGPPYSDWGNPRGAEPETPEIGGRAFQVTARIESPNPQGVVLAQGGQAFGYALYFQDGRPAFAFRNQHQLTTLIAEQPLSGTRTLQATVAQDAITLTVDGQPVASIESPGLLRQQPGLGLYVGYDGVHPVGDYDVPNAFQGIIWEHHIAVADSPAPQP